MVQASDLTAENQYQYNRLLVALEASQGNKLNLLIAVCDDRNLQADMINAYEQEMRGMGVQAWRVFVQWHEPSLRLALERLVTEQPALQSGQPSLVTVLGIDSLVAVRLGQETSQQERFFGYLQWTREALQQFQFPVVVWMTSQVLVQLAEKAPDFWSWRGGVFWFGLRPEEIPEQTLNWKTTAQPEPEPTGFRAALDELLRRIDRLEQQPNQQPEELARLFEQLGEAYANRMHNGPNRQFAIQAFQRAIQLQKQLRQQRPLAESWFRLGNLYFETQNNVKQAAAAYDEALGLYREVGARVGEANTLQAIGDVLQFLKQSQEALTRYDEALGLYREVGDRLGEANTLQAIGDVLQFLDQRQEALTRYDEALGLYREVGARLGEANTLQAIGDVLQFLKQSQEALTRYDEALGLYREVGDRVGEANTLKAIGDVLQFLDQRQEALTRYDEALGLYREVGDRLGEANTLRAIGDVLQFLKQSQEALTRYDEALGLYREVGDRLGEANTLQAIGDVLQFLDQRQEALTRYDEALGLYREVGARLGEANTLRAIGYTKQVSGQLNEAVALYENALATYRAIGDRWSTAVTLQRLAPAYQQLGQIEESKHAKAEAEELLDMIKAF